MNLPAIFIANAAAVILLTALLISVSGSLHYGSPDKKVFFLMGISAMLQSIVETASFFADGSDFRVAVLLLNSFLFINNITFCFLWAVYADLKLFADTDRIKRIYKWIALPGILVIVGSIVNLFTPVFYSVSADNVYARSTLYPFTYLVTYLYLTYGVVLIYRYRYKVSKYLLLPAISFMIPILLGSIAQYLFYGVSLIWISAAIALACLYISMQDEASSIDSLSGLFTRQYMNQFLSARLSRMDEKSEPLVGMMLDVDNFKAINDTYGHISGDNAIAAIGRVLHRSVPPKKGFAARYAGDEFVIILAPGDAAAAQESIRVIRENTEKLNASGKHAFQIQFSIGYSVYQPGDSMDTFLRRLDAAMYVEKNQKKALSGKITE